MGFPDSSVGKESACNAGDPSSIPGSGRYSGEGMDYPLQYSWVSLMAQGLNNLPTMWETWVWLLGWEDPLEKGKATHFSILARRIPWAVQSMGSQRVWHNWVTFTFPYWNDWVRIWIWFLEHHFLCAAESGLALCTVTARMENHWLHSSLNRVPTTGLIQS